VAVTLLVCIIFSLGVYLFLFFALQVAIYFDPLRTEKSEIGYDVSFQKHQQTNVGVDNRDTTQPCAQVTAA
jgi:hypothetical protein